jgi:hypothetical protein
MTGTSTSEPAKTTGSLYGLGLELEASDAELLSEMLSYLPPAWRPGEAPEGASSASVARGDDGLYTVFFNGRAIASDIQPDEAFEEFERSVRQHLALRARDYFFLHAGAVAYDGKGIVVLGASFSGKTSLVNALIRAGCVYFSDEHAVFDTDGLLHPYPKPLGLRLTDGLDAQTPQDVGELGGVPGDAPVPVGLVVATDYRPGSHWEPELLSPSETVQVLHQHAYQGLLRPEQLLRVTHAAARDAAGFKGDRGEADETAELILERLAEHV